MSKYLTTKEAAERLHVHPDTLRRWVKEGGKFSHLGLKETAGGHKRYSEEDLQKLAQEISKPEEVMHSPIVLEVPENAQAYSCERCAGSGEQQGYVCTACRGTGAYWIRKQKRPVSKNKFIQRWKEKGRVDDAFAFSILAPIAVAALGGFLIIGLGLAIGGEGEPTQAFIDFVTVIMYLMMAFFALCGLLLVYGIVSKIVFWVDGLFTDKEIEVIQRGEQVGSEISWKDLAGHSTLSDTIAIG